MWLRTGNPHLADSQNVVDVQALEQRPHGEVDINQATPEIKSARETSDDLEI